VAKRIAMEIAASRALVPLVVLQRLLNQHAVAKSLSRKPHVAPMASVVVIKPATANAVKQVHVQLAAALRQKRLSDKFQSQLTLI
jgi:hypothetical protein